MLKVILTKQFKKDLRRIQKRGFDINYIMEVAGIIAEGRQLPAMFRDHSLKGSYIGRRECHPGFDWLLIYEIHNDTLILELIRTGTHQDVLND